MLLVPLCRNAHWTLYVVMFSHKVILCIDSLHGLISSDVLPKLCGFIEKLHMRIDMPVFNRIGFPSPSRYTQSEDCGRSRIQLWHPRVCLGVYNLPRKILDIWRKWYVKCPKMDHDRTFESQKNKKYINIKNDRDMFHIQKIVWKIVFKNDTANNIQISIKPPMASQSTLEYCASLKLLTLRNY